MNVIANDGDGHAWVGQLWASTLLLEARDELQRESAAWQNFRFSWEVDRSADRD